MRAAHPLNVRCRLEEGTVLHERALAGLLLLVVLAGGVWVGLSVKRVPDVNGLALEDAVQVLADAGHSRVVGLDAQGQPVVDGFHTVEAQSPSAGSLAWPDSTVRLGVLEYTQDFTVEVPTLTGLTGRDAITLLEEVGLRSPLSQGWDRSVVASQTVRPGTKVPLDTEVGLGLLHPHSTDGSGATWAEFEPVHGVFYLYYGYAQLKDSCSACHGPDYCAAKGCHARTSFETLAAIVDEARLDDATLEVGR